ncbi:MAG TPA: YceK/YidQ family lipoprotein, partial [Pseudomonas sp.]|nr:YceK/YidQ family lipoprotein [Pseudomonas sp.]
MNKPLIILLVLQLAGCATARTLDAAKPGSPVVYSGTRLDLYAMNGGCCAMDRFGAEAPSYPGVDLPASAL